MKKLPTGSYGLLLTFDGYGADTARCKDVGRLYAFLYDLPQAIGMRRLGYPHIVSVTEAGIRGLSAFTFIMESHISIHTYEERGFVTADVYSCKAFDSSLVSSLLSSYFKTDSHTTHTHVRGKHFDSTLPRQRKKLRKLS